MADYRAKYGEWALVVGGSMGLGAAIADELAQRGMNVAIVARHSGPLQETAARLRETRGVETTYIVCDAGRADVVETIEEGLGGIEPAFLVFNCAAEHGGLFFEVPVEHHRENIAVNCVAPTLLAHHFGRKMAARGKGGIALCSSLAGEQGSFWWVSYGAAKSYDAIMGEGLWDELAECGIDACAFMIGATYTPNFIRNQKKRGTIFAETRTPAGLPEGTPVPQAPEEAAELLFAQLDRGWLPRIYANPRDAERIARMNSSLTREETVRTMGKAFRKTFLMKT